MTRASRISSRRAGISPEPARARTAEAILERAAAAVLDAWHTHGAEARGEVEAELERLLQTIREDGADAGGSSSGGRTRARAGNRLLARRLVGALRRATIVDWQDRRPSPDATPYLDALAALEDLHLATLPEDDRGLTSRLAEPDGFEVLIEAAHDLRSPLTSIGFLAETLREGHSGDVNDLQHSQLGLIYSAAQGMTSLVSDIVDLARHGSDLLQGTPEVFAISDALHEVERLLRPVAEEKGVHFSVDHRAHDRVRGYPLALSRALLNLATNGLKFTDEGRVWMSTRQVDHQTVEFSVGDTGRGIPPEAQQGLFRPYRPSSNARGIRFSGSGLGLSIVRRLVRAMGSELTLESEPGRGSVFSFELRVPPVAHL